MAVSIEIMKSDIAVPSKGLTKKKHGLIPFYIPHAGCPQQCIFCNQHRISSGGARATAVDVKATIEEYIGTERELKYWEVAFYGGSFSALPKELQISLLEPAYEALQGGLIDGIRCSTRPDALSDEAIDLLVAYGVSTVEIGVQSMDETILVNSKRGHTSADVVGAVGRLQRRGLTVGIQLLPGLPGENWHTLVPTAVKVGRLQPDFVRIYPVLVIADTELAEAVAEGTYTPLTVEEAVAYSAFLKTYFEDKQIEVIRTGLQSTPELDAGIGLVGGPYEPAMGELVVNCQWQQKLEGVLQAHEAEFMFASHTVSTLGSQRQRKKLITIIYPRSLTSKLRGEKQRNMKYFATKYSQYNWQWCEWDSKVAQNIWSKWEVTGFVIGDASDEVKAAKTTEGLNHSYMAKNKENVCLIIDNIRYTVV